MTDFRTKALHVLLNLLEVAGPRFVHQLQTLVLHRPTSKAGSVCGGGGVGLGGGSVLIQEKDILPRSFSFMPSYLAAREAKRRMCV